MYSFLKIEFYLFDFLNLFRSIFYVQNPFYFYGVLKIRKTF
ncbi:hypothetical protein LEP1GSC075_1948 [Leptospira interrogans str. Kito]|nr:hypothetical protein LEP1GSC014_4309 [Leptospira interrogans serovar Pomona str. Pomona]EKO70849.1 hypothetical protein LEP1GSC069_0442 [Leptospira interrogans serovar Canicola str. Fiocruz LV133]EKO89286.1 hypothetical protein LEP1GSC009_4060 [Leptospira interrogans serovar Grippotyphosa str. Andaman]EKR83657.1 hypothetical protein LEP1GSC099_2298 [Leptospira interrogans str. UI 08452]EMJ51678.1 hypothetical protein LEP1GSC111_3632 [Leptospira interrogans str. UT126]EMK15492.1 hypothetical